jgi:hypothetical protein
MGQWIARLAGSVERTRILADAGTLGGAKTVHAFVDCIWSGVACGRTRDDLFTLARRLSGSQQMPSGAFLPPDPSMNPETAWYFELVLLHAVSTYDPISASRNAEYHLTETQPDHATTEPWGLLAFIRNRNTHSVADRCCITFACSTPAAREASRLFCWLTCSTGFVNSCANEVRLPP